MITKVYIWIDDIRNPNDTQYKAEIQKKNINDLQVVWIKSYEDFVLYIETSGVPAVIDFDHDLGIDANGIEKNGNDCAKYIINYCIDNHIRVPQYFIHSANVVGADNIKSLFDTYNKIQIQYL